MKFLRYLLSSCIICLVLMMSIEASSDPQYVYEYNIPEVTVSFSSNNGFSEQKRQVIANNIAGLQNENVESESTRNIICSIFGHDLSSGEVISIKHKVSHRDPRCLLEIYDVVSCSRCDYLEQNLISSRHISCHPEELPLPENTNPTE